MALSSSIPNSINKPGICTSSTRPAGYAGMLIYETDTKRSLLYDGTGWIVMSEPTITSFAPVVTAASGTITTLGTVTFGYERSDGWLTWWCNIAVTTNGTGAGNVLFTLPVLPNPTQIFLGSGRENLLYGYLLFVTLNGSTAVIGNYNNTYPAANGTGLRMSGRYQMTTRYS